jgi:hypothetical protein
VDNVPSHRDKLRQRQPVDAGQARRTWQAGCIPRTRRCRLCGRRESTPSPPASRPLNGRHQP